MSLFDSISEGWDNLKGFVGDTLGDITGQNRAFEYQKQLNEATMSREDNAFQRAVADAKAAGLSPLSVSGGASANSMTSARIDNSSALSAGLSFASALARLKIDKQNANTNETVGESIAEKNKADTDYTGKKSAYQDIINAWLPKKEQLTLDEISARIAKLQTESWSIREGNERADKDLASLIGVRESEIANRDAKTKELVETLTKKLLQYDADRALTMAQESLAKAGKSLNDIKTLSEQEKYTFLTDLLESQLNVDEATIKNLDAQNTNLAFKSASGIIASIIALGTYVTHFIK